MPPLLRDSIEVYFFTFFICAFLFLPLLIRAKSSKNWDFSLSQSLGIALTTGFFTGWVPVFLVLLIRITELGKNSSAIWYELTTVLTFLAVTFLAGSLVLARVLFAQADSNLYFNSFKEAFLFSLSVSLWGVLTYFLIFFLADLLQIYFG